MSQNQHHIFIDTNIFIGAYSGKEADSQCVKYLYSLTKRGKKLFTSALSIAQCISVFQKKKSNGEIEKIVRNIMKKVETIDFTKKDVSDALSVNGYDIEDNIQYLISKKRKCLYFITNNYKDYRVFQDIKVLNSSKIRTITR